MRTEQWASVQSIFSAVSELPAEEQEAALHRLCGDNRELADAVRALLEEDRRAHPLLDAPLGELAEAALSHDHVRSLVQQQIGPYRLLRLLGEGGMGVVYLAERTTVGGTVAIKFLRDAWLSPMRRERFVLEQKLLAALSHPSIARLYDANTLDDGTPWFVMEYAEGQPLTEWLSIRGATLRETLLCFRQICEAVHYAHSRAVVHRDLKPSNILVSPSGEIKLLDFGIARQLEDDPGASRTMEGLRLMTPAYAAPEQKNGGSIGVFTDVYGLGVLLYEILTGQLPETRDLTEAPRRPSLIVAAHPEHSRFRLTRREWADLDAVCLTALDPHPDRRYRSVDALRDDLDAFLEGRVLRARHPGFLYTAGKFARRNRAALLTAAAAIILIVAATLAFTLSLARARDAALAQVARTNRLQHFTEGLFDGGSASAGPSADLRVPDLLRRGEMEADGIRGDPAMQAQMFSTLGGVYEHLGQFDRADALLQRALLLRKQTFGTNDAGYAASLIALGLLRKDQGRMADAEKLIRQGADLERQLALRNDPDLEHALWALGTILNLRGKYTESTAVLQAAVERGERFGPGTEQLADDLAGLADAHTYLSDFGPAAALNRQALAIYRRLFGDGHPSVGKVLNNLGNIEMDLGHTSEAEADFRQALAVDEKWYGPDHPDVAADLNSLAQVLVDLKKYSEAQTLLIRALTMERQAYGNVHNRVALIYNELGMLADVRDQDQQAETYFRQALDIWLQVYGDKHPFVGLSYANIASSYMHRHLYSQAEESLRRAISIYHQSLPPGHAYLAIARTKLGRTLLHERRYADAEPETLAGYRYFSSHESEYASYLTGSRKDLIEIERHLHNTQMLAQLETTPPLH